MKPYQPFGGRQGGGGAPNRTESGKVAAGFRADPELRFPRHASKPNVEPVLVSMAVPQIYYAPPLSSLYSGQYCGEHEMWLWMGISETSN